MFDFEICELRFFEDGKPEFSGIFQGAMCSILISLKAFSHLRFVVRLNWFVFPLGAIHLGRSEHSNRTQDQTNRTETLWEVVSVRSQMNSEAVCFWWEHDPTQLLGVLCEFERTQLACLMRFGSLGLLSA